MPGFARCVVTMIMTTALDTNVLIDLDEGVPHTVEPLVRAIEEAAEKGAIVICGIVYAELFGNAASRALVDEMLRSACISVDFDLRPEVWAHAGAAFGAYAMRRRRSGAGAPRRILADFIIGAHACTVGSLVTRDGAFYRRAFPEMRVIDVRGSA